MLIYLHKQVGFGRPVHRNEKPNGFQLVQRCELTLENDFLAGALGKAGLLGGKK
ncbi:hypothetical protein HF206_05680 [Rhizobium leguminosarum]|nr:hypothetical protein [Rhizobium leguminosarum]MBY2969153.1 hypothetical protein [Rhizobium leguminosarum]MBY2976526.1 hypothetical protein [Rhizobium leguminosarum]MBY2998186.1 hypothetical protein [Rhizobium leguminosarum]MBY3005077.1 hypothetical protein [Rhizobium leguminosarum]